MDPVQDQQPTAAAQTAPETPPPEKAAPAAEPQPGPLNPPALPPEAPPTGKEAFQAGESAPTPTRYERADANYQLASQSSILGALGGDAGLALRAAQGKLAEWKDAANGQPDLQPDQANQKFPGMPVPFSTPISPALAELQWNYQQHKEALSDWASRGTDEHPWDKTVNSFAAQMSDPTTPLIASGLGKAIGLVAPAATGAVASFGRVVAESAGFNAVSAGAGYLQSLNEHQKAEIPSAEEFAAGTAQMIGMHYGGKLLGNLLFGVKSAAQAKLEALKTPPDIQEGNQRTAIAQHEAGAAIDMTAGENERATRAAAPGPDGPGTFDPVDHPSQAPYYAARDAAGNPQHYTGLGGPNSLEVIRNGVEANNRVSSPTDGQSGHLAELSPKSDQKFLDLDQPASVLETDPELKGIVDTLEAKLGDKLEVNTDDTIKDVLTRLQGEGLHGASTPDILDQVKAEAQAAGYDGYRYGANDAQGSAKGEGLVLFDPNPEATREFAANPDITPQVDANSRKANIDNTTTAEAGKDMTPELQAQIHEAHQSAPLNSTPDYMDPLVEQMTQGFRDALDQAAKEDPGLAKELEALDRQEVKESQTLQAMKDFATCLVGGIT